MICNKSDLQVNNDDDQSNPGESIGLKYILSQSELSQFIPISVSEQIRIIPNQSEKCFVSCLMKNGQK